MFLVKTHSFKEKIKKIVIKITKKEIFRQKTNDSSVATEAPKNLIYKTFKINE